LGVFLYNKKYPAGAPGQTPSTAPDARLFSQTGHKVGGKFLAYWNTHGGLAQQGYPISDEFQEVSDLNGQTYTVQYFERSVFELHTENQPPNDVLLSQLGTFRLRDKQSPAPPKPAQPTPTSPPAPPASTPVPPQPTNTPVPQGPCVGVPAPGPDVLVLPSNCERAGTLFSFTARGFQPHENVGAYITAPDQSVFGANFQLTTDEDGYIEGGVTFQTRSNFPLGLWAITFEGVDSHVTKVIYFKLY
jgi:hypothetical protein